MMHLSFEGLPTFIYALSKDKGQAFLFLGRVKVCVIVFKEMLLSAKKITTRLGIITLQMYEYNHFKF